MHLYMESRDRIFIKEDYKKLSEEREKLHKKMADDQNGFEQEVYEMEKTVKELATYKPASYSPLP